MHELHPLDGPGPVKRLMKNGSLHPDVRTLLAEVPEYQCRSWPLSAGLRISTLLDLINAFIVDFDYLLLATRFRNKKCVNH